MAPFSTQVTTPAASRRVTIRRQGPWGVALRDIGHRCLDVMPDPARTPFRRRLALVLLPLVAVVAVLAVRPAILFPPPLPDALPVAYDARQAVFGYATLSNPLVRSVVVRRWVPSEPAQLSGYRQVGRDLAPMSGGVVEGRVFEVGPLELRRLDRYERLGDLYQRMQKDLDDGTRAWVYRRIE